jgi:hypothetical protein
MHNARGVSIAIEQVVIVIISIVILSLGVSLAFKIYSTSERQLAPVTGQLEQEIERALSSGSVVEMPVATKKISAKDMAEFGFGIKNDPAVTGAAPSNQPNNDFTVTISYGSALSPAGVDICQIQQCISGMKNAMVLPPEFIWTEGNNNVGYYSYSFSIPENKIKAFGLGILPKNNPSYGGRGQYYYNLCVCNSQNCAKPCTAEKFAEDANTGNNPYGFVTFSVIVG